MREKQNSTADGREELWILSLCFAMSRWIRHQVFTSKSYVKVDSASSFYQQVLCRGGLDVKFLPARSMSRWTRRQLLPASSMSRWARRQFFYRHVLCRGGLGGKFYRHHYVEVDPT
ncbi:hypothetical protein AVEN_187494-1 [Araneus ventricosus]|uniref:Uncharacterized protein n=1 Tax=Araneus ventricosus TaxID=182803 RepID=A0A4Y2BV50_ARAVE|nr:hypothetical protein AVEN_187494-1 [Araneus ventricosus]